MSVSDKALLELLVQRLHFNWRQYEKKFLYFDSIAGYSIGQIPKHSY